ncbi:glycerol kinase [Eubacteriales bacterium OttesenSCG-928-A19]|nr:glycerol kinase [Eubacteriales bacterium OttesenSCG-928-A19]
MRARICAPSEGIQTVASGVTPSDLVAIAIANQRETTVLWDRRTGRPVCRAIVWQDVRGKGLCDGLEAHADAIRARTGLALSPYYSAAKAATALCENPGLDPETLCIGTMDAYLVHRLTGGEVFQTDVSNASRTQLMNLETLAWDDDLCRWFGIPKQCLPDIAHSDASFGTAKAWNLPILSVLGDSHASFFGLGCHARGMVKASYGTGSSIMMHIGSAPIQSQNGLSCSVGYAFDGEVCYVLEGNVTSCGDTLNWLRDGAEMIGAIDEIEPLARSVPDAGGVYLVPALSGLGAPYFDEQATGVFSGLRRGTTRAHMVRAALESLAYQDADVIRAMRRDTGIAPCDVRVDGGGTQNALLMQFQSDLLGCALQCAPYSELSALGVGYMAGIRAGVFTDMASIPAMEKQGARYEAAMDSDTREAHMRGWALAVRRARLT